PQKLLNFIDGKYQEPLSGKYMPNFDPSTGEVYSELADSNELDVIVAIQAATKAFEKWKNTTAEARSKILYRIADLIELNLEKLAAAESRDQGKPIALARTMDIPRAAWNFRFFASLILHKEEMATDMDGTAINYVLR